MPATAGVSCVTMAVCGGRCRRLFLALALWAEALADACERARGGDLRSAPAACAAWRTW